VMSWMADGSTGDGMQNDERRAVILHGDTRINVASLLQELSGSTREYQIELDRLPLDADLVANDIVAEVWLTRIKDAVLVEAEVGAIVPLECVTCLTEFDQPVAETFSEPFRQSVDVRTGAPIAAASSVEPADDDEPAFSIDESHELDLREALRQWIVLSIPMQPSCGPKCPGPPDIGNDGDDAIDERFASLASLLGDDETER
jgi:uncharacterized protein